MKTPVLGIIGDSLPRFARPQQAMIEMIHRAAKELGAAPEIRWIPTPSILTTEGRAALDAADALWCSPGSPYLSLEGALAGIRFAREKRRPFLGTCAGFQHTVLEWARNVVGIEDAASQEYDPAAANLLVTALSCPIATQTLKIELLPGSRARSIYGRPTIEEYYYCNFGLNPEFQNTIVRSGLVLAGVDQNGEPRVLEWPEHPFFVVTLFVPGASYVEGIIRMSGAHPLVKGWLQAAAVFAEERRTTPV